MREELITEMHAKVLERVPMTLSVEQIKDVLEALDRPFVHPGVQDVSAEPAVEAATEEPSEPKGPLPEDFPARAILADAGIHTFHQLRKQRDSEEGLTGVPGIGDATAAKIEEALNGN